MHPWAFHWLHEISIPKRIRHRLKPEWEMRRTRWGGSTGCIMHQVHTSNESKHNNLAFSVGKANKSSFSVKTKKKD
jgi:hypothetical protein